MDLIFSTPQSLLHQGQVDVLLPRLADHIRHKALHAINLSQNRKFLNILLSSLKVSHRFFVVKLRFP